MLVQALATYADTYLGDQLQSPAFEEKPVPFLVEIDPSGRFVGVARREASRGNLGKATVPPLTVPRSPVNRNSGIHPLLGADAIQYVVGPAIGKWSKPEEEIKHKKHHDAFAKLISDLAGESRLPVLLACKAFYDSPAEVEKARQILIDSKADAGSIVALSVIGKDGRSIPVVKDPDVRKLWEGHFDARLTARNEAGGQGMCLVSGRNGTIAPTHDKIKGFGGKLGGQAAGVALISFDKPAFCSYGWEQNQNGPVCPDRATAYVLALNDLMRPGKHRAGASRDTVLKTRTDHGGLAFLYWTRRPRDDDPVSLVEDADPQVVADLLAAPLSGDRMAGIGAEDDDFYLLAVCGNGGRLVVKSWAATAVQDLRGNLRAWFEGLRIADVFKHGQIADPPKLWQLLAATVPRRQSPAETLEQVPGDRAIRLLRRALLNSPLDFSLLAAVLDRLRAAVSSDRLDAARMALVRLTLNDILISRKGGTPVPESLDPSNDHPAYLCGRLLAIFDRLQYAAQGEVGTSVTDRYYAMASTFPALAFPKLEQLSRAHLKKLRRDNMPAAVAIERSIHELASRLRDRFPRSLSLEDQGRFAIGFHHQKAEDEHRRQAAVTKKAQVDAGSEVLETAIPSAVPAE